VRGQRQVVELIVEPHVDVVAFVVAVIAQDVAQRGDGCCVVTLAAAEYHARGLIRVGIVQFERALAARRCRPGILRGRQARKRQPRAPRNDGLHPASTCELHAQFLVLETLQGLAI